MTAGGGILYLWVRLLFKGHAFRNPFLYCLLSACIPVFLLLIYYQDIEKSKKPVILPIITLTLVVWGLSFWNNWREIEHTTAELTQTFRQWQRDTSAPLVHYNLVFELIVFGSIRF